MIGVIDYGKGNLLSVCNAVEFIGESVVRCEHPDQILKADRLILPGVGAFKDAMDTLRKKGFIDVLDEVVRNMGRPILGICLGMQMMAEKSYEFGEYKGLGWFEAEVVQIRPNNPDLRIPQIGWNNVRFQGQSTLFSSIPHDADFYFVHSYHLQCRESADVLATCDYGGTITAAVCKDNIFATQFHPEKSQDYGLTLLENFMRWNP